MKFSVPGNPVAKGRGRAVRTPKGVRVVTPEKTRRFEDRVEMYANMAGVVRLDGPLRVTIDAYWEWPKGKWRKGVPRPKTPRDNGPDGDNIAKAVCDALNGLCWTDDRQVADLRVRKWYAAQGDAARTEIQVMRLRGACGGS